MYQSKMAPPWLLVTLLPSNRVDETLNTQKEVGKPPFSARPIAAMLMAPPLSLAELPEKRDVWMLMDSTPPVDAHPCKA